MKHEMIECMKNHPSITHIEEIKQLCEPLHSLDITTFSHLRVFNNNQLTVQCNNAPFFLNYLKEKYYVADPCVNVHPESTDIGEYLLWDSVHCTGKTAKMLADSSLFNFKHVFSIIKKQKDQTDFYHFGTHLSTPAIHQIYINNLDTLDRFIAFFNSETKKSKALLPAYDMVLNPDQRESNIELDQDIFSNQIKKAIHLQKWTGYDCLTQKEIQCVELLLQGKTSKEIAKELYLSHRTIEARINALKVKLHAKNKADLVVKLLKNSYF